MLRLRSVGFSLRRFEGMFLGDQSSVMNDSKVDGISHVLIGRRMRLLDDGI